MRSQFDKQLAQLHRELIEMGALCEQVIALSSQALTNRDTALAEKVAPLDHEIDRKERDIENLCLRLLLQQQPVAGDLRQISAALKMITDMERIGDQAADIADIVIDMNEKLPDKFLHVCKMGVAAMKMVTDSVTAYVEEDLELARQVIRDDDIVDGLFLKVRGEILDAIRDGGSKGEEVLDLFMITKYYERIGDHAADIAEITPHLVTVRKEGDPAVSQAIAMGRKAYQIIQDAMAALTAEDELAARKVIAADDAVDFDFNAIKHTLAQEIAADPAKVDAALDLLMVIKYLERIGDHAVNVAEWVQFVRTGRYKDESMF